MPLACFVCLIVGTILSVCVFALWLDRNWWRKDARLARSANQAAQLRSEGYYTRMKELGAELDEVVCDRDEMLRHERESTITDGDGDEWYLGEDGFFHLMENTGLTCEQIDYRYGIDDHRGCTANPNE